MEVCDQRGMYSILIAVGIVSVLGTISLTTQMATSLAARKQIRRMQAAQTFHLNEIAAWHGYFRLQAGLTTNQRASVQLDNRYSDSVDLIPDTYSAARGIALNISTTLALAPSRTLARLYSSDSTKYEGGVGSSPCAFSKTQAMRTTSRLCLASINPATTPYLFLAKANMVTGSLWAVSENGSIATTFGVNGKLALWPAGINNGGGNTSAYALLRNISIDPNKKFLSSFEGQVSSNSASEYGLARFSLTDGSRDMTFGNAGLIEWAAAGSYHGLPPLSSSDGGFYLINYVQGNLGDVTFSKVRRDGSPDTDYGENGHVRIDVDSGSYDTPTDWTLDDRGRLLILGLLNRGQFNGHFLMRVNLSGHLDASFGHSTRKELEGGVEVDHETRNGIKAYDGTINADRFVDGSKTLVLLSLKQVLRRYDEDGNPDASFGMGGDISYAGQVELTNDHFLYPNGRLLSYSHISFSSGGKINAKRFLPNGALDGLFGTGGTATISVVDPNEFLESSQPLSRLFVAKDERIMVLKWPNPAATSAGNVQGDKVTAVIRLKSDGSPDPTFGQQGRIEIDTNDQGRAGAGAGYTGQYLWLP